MLAKRVADAIEPLTSEDRVNAFIVDDSLFSRTSCKATELAVRVFDHCDMRYKQDYRLMILTWTDGNTNLPVNSSLLSSSDDHNILGTTKEHDGRTFAGQRKKFARTKGMTVMVELIGHALAVGFKADYVLFDTWFSTPARLLDIKGLELDAIAMIKKSGKIRYLYEGQRLSISKIFGLCKKRRGRSQYLLSVNVEIEKNGVRIPVKIVCVRNRNNRKDWIALISTNPELSAEEIIRIYGKHW